MARRESLLSAPYQTRPPEGDDARATDRWLRGLSLAATIAALATIVLGALVRATGAGDACGDHWPVCNGRWIPEFDTKVLIEYTHRLATPVLIGLIGGLALLAVVRYRGVRRVALPAVAAFLLLFVQAALGALVVRRGLSPLLVTFHLGTAMILVATLVSVTVSARTLRAERAPAADPLTKFARVAGGHVFVLLLVGAAVRGENAGLASLSWPLMDGGLAPDLGDPHVAIMFAHRVLAAAVFVVVGLFARRAWRKRTQRPAVAGFAMAAVVLYAAQVLVGAANIWTLLAPAAVVAHVALSALIWTSLVAASGMARATAPIEVEAA
jgi:cytochrome c oxidase assembly protein subunit 15